jgi:hypothetical protein
MTPQTLFKPPALLLRIFSAVGSVVCFRCQLHTMGLIQERREKFMHRVERTVLIVIIACLPLFAVAQQSEGLEVGPVDYFNITDSPFSGPVETLVFSSHPTVKRGTGTDVFVVVQNHSNEATVTVNIGLELEWADGSQKHPFHLGQDRQHTLGPNEGVGFIIFYAVPDDAPLGASVFRTNAQVGRVTGVADGHRENPNPMIASDFANFEVVP